MIFLTFETIKHPLILKTIKSINQSIIHSFSHDWSNQLIYEGAAREGANATRVIKRVKFEYSQPRKAQWLDNE